MIGYETGRWGLRFVFRLKGSVFPKACAIALPNAVAAILLHYLVSQDPEGDKVWHLKGLSKVWGGYTAVLSFLIVFRNDQAYKRFWEGATQIREFRQECFNAVNSLMAFCSTSEEYAERVHDFQHKLIRLASLLHCSALQEICELDNDQLEILELEKMSKDRLHFLQMSKDRCEIVMQWIQRLLLDAHKSGTLDVGAPIITRPLAELSGTMMRLNNAERIQEIPFPFPYAQLITSMLMVHWITTPFIAREVIKSVLVKALTCFFVTFALWCLAFITMEMDQPFGEDPNDLPLHDMQRDFNESLLTLMYPLAQQAPTFSFDEDPNAAKLVVRKNLGQAVADDFSGAHGCLSESDMGRVQKMASIRTLAAPSLKHNSLSSKESRPRQRKTWSGRLRNGARGDEASDADVLTTAGAGGSGSSIAGGSTDSGSGAGLGDWDPNASVLLGRVSADPEAVAGGGKRGSQKRGGVEAAAHQDEQYVATI